MYRKFCDISEARLRGISEDANFTMGLTVKVFDFGGTFLLRCVNVCHFRRYLILQIIFCLFIEVLRLSMFALSTFTVLTSL